VGQRRHGRYSSRALVVGTRADIEYVIRSLGTNGVHGYTVVGALIGSAPNELWEAVRVPAISVVLWLALLTMLNTRHRSIIGSGATEYKRVAQATGFSFGLLAALFVITQLPGIRIQLVAALPVGLFLLLVSRWACRRWLVGQRRHGRYSSRALVVGTRADIEYVIRSLGTNGVHGYTVVGAATADADAGPIVIDDRTYEIVGTTNTVAASARALGADSIIVASTDLDDPDMVKRISWQLEGAAAELILSSRLVDVAGPRLSLRPVDGLPLIHVQIPEFEGGKHILKRAMDIVVATLALIPIALLTPFLALLIKVDSRGPVFFRQTRIGRDGREFKMVKFRTMRVTAEAELAALVAANDGAGPLFKMKRDPRITRVGAILRKFSLDELPQFWNVLVGDMSVVGPRPPLPSEVTTYNGTVFRRLYIKPGITGLWQVSGRSDLSWDESVRLDLRYVENWSVMSDLMIMWRTAAVMIAPQGAY
jgi:exopolysaccharide biosynthesis polyprenyl glycosylphosphotransferase